MEGIKISMWGFSFFPVEWLWRWNFVLIRWFLGDYTLCFYVEMRNGFLYFCE